MTCHHHYASWRRLKSPLFCFICWGWTKIEFKSISGVKSHAFGNKLVCRLSVGSSTYISGPNIGIMLNTFLFVNLTLGSDTCIDCSSPCLRDRLNLSHNNHHHRNRKQYCCYRHHSCSSPLYFFWLHVNDFDGLGFHPWLWDRLSFFHNNRRHHSASSIIVIVITVVIALVLLLTARWWF